MPKSPQMTAAALIAVVLARICNAGTLLLSDGRAIDGDVVKVSSVAEDPFSPKAIAGEVTTTPIVLVDDGLRRVYVNNKHVKQVLDVERERKIRIRLWQSVADRGGGVTRVGRSINVTPFDEFGRRIYEMQSSDGPLAVVQGITEVTADYAKLEGLVGQPRPIVWDMRIATSSIPRDTLARILKTAIQQDDLDARLQVVRLYVQAERYPDARKELEAVVVDFPEHAEDLKGELRQLRQLAARSILKEIDLRRDSGQHKLASALLDNFPTDGVAGETLQQVRGKLTEYEQYAIQQQQVAELLAGEVAKLVDARHRKLAESFVAEVKAEASPNTINRFAAFLRLAEDEALSAEEKVAVALSGWLLGVSEADSTFAVAISLVEVRELIRQYLVETNAAKRAEIIAAMRSLEGGTPERVALLLKQMKPPEPLIPDWETSPGCYSVPIEAGQGLAPASYLVQLPPEYDPLRKYPTIVSLNGLGYRPELQLDYWAGSPVEGVGRRGQAMRQGYITISVNWQQPHQFEFTGSLREHAAVLSALADAVRRFSIDTDRVFLTGHDIGGDAAWDIGLAHPDLWAGVIPFIAEPKKYVPRYRDNGHYVAWYIVQGELDGGKIATYSAEFDRYLGLSFDSTLIEYQGRGHEPYSDEIQRLVDWMNRRRRGPPPVEFECSTMRPWDNFFWWAEVADIPEKSIVLPAAWPPKRGVRPTTVRGRKYATNKIALYSQVGRATIWLSPDVIDFEKPLEVELNGRSLMGRDRFIAPDLSVLLEDARTRGDRQHPFWARLDWP